jgi:hypothetical protein
VVDGHSGSLQEDRGCGSRLEPQVHLGSSVMSGTCMKPGHTDIRRPRPGTPPGV